MDAPGLLNSITVNYVCEELRKLTFFHVGVYCLSHAEVIVLYVAVTDTRDTPPTSKLESVGYGYGDPQLMNRYCSYLDDQLGTAMVRPCVKNHR